MGLESLHAAWAVLQQPRPEYQGLLQLPLTLLPYHPPNQTLGNPTSPLE